MTTIAQLLLTEEVTWYGRLAVPSPGNKIMAVVQSHRPERHERLELFLLPWKDDLGTYRPVIPFDDGPICSLAFSPDSSHLVIVGTHAISVRRNFRGPVVRLDDVSQGVVARMEGAQIGDDGRAVMSSDNTLVAVCHNNGLTVIYSIDRETGTLVPVQDREPSTTTSTGIFGFTDDNAQFFIQDGHKLQFFTIQR